MELSLNDLDALVSKGARQLVKAEAKPQKKSAVNEDAMVSQGDAFLESLGYDEYDNYDDEPAPAPTPMPTAPRQQMKENKQQYTPRKLNETELASAANFNVSPEAMQKSKLPTAIKNLVAENMNTVETVPVNEDKFDKIRRIMKESDELTSTNGIVKKKPTPQPVLDYNVIKQIVSECLQEQQNVLTENTLKSIHLKAGVISLVDNSGNIFRAKLEYVGNKNNKK